MEEEVGAQTPEEAQTLEDAIEQVIGTVETVETVETQENDVVTYTINLSQRGKPKLLDSRGFSYTIRYKKPCGTYWRCSVRRRSERCGASVVQKGDEFKPGPIPHKHESNPNTESVTKLLSYIKWKALSDTSKPATEVVREAYLETFGGDISSPAPGVPKVENLARCANRVRQSVRNGDSMLSAEDFIPEDSGSTPSMVFQYRLTSEKIGDTGKRRHKLSKRKKNKSKKKEKRMSSSSSTAETSPALFWDDSSSLPHLQGSISLGESDTSKAKCFKEIGSLIAERDAALKRIDEIEKLLHAKYQIKVVDRV